MLLEIVNEPKNYVKNGSHTLGPTLKWVQNVYSSAFANYASTIYVQGQDISTDVAWELLPHIHRGSQVCSH
jgi:hypothetical protein